MAWVPMLEAGMQTDAVQKLLAMFRRGSLSGHANSLSLQWGDETIARGELSVLSDAREITQNLDVLVDRPGQADEEADGDRYYKIQNGQDDDEQAKPVGPLKLSDTLPFQNLVCAIIFANSMCIALEAWFIQNAALQVFFSIIEFFFTLAYCAEIWQRWKDHSVWGYFFGPKPFWNWFDFIVTALGVFSIFLDVFAGSSAIRIFRIMRLARSLRIAKFMQDIEFVLYMAVQAVGKLFGLTVLGIFMWSILFTELLWNTGEAEISSRFGDLNKSLWSLFVLMTMNDWVNKIMPVIGSLPGMIGLFIAFIFLCAIALLTLVPAMFVDQSMTKREREVEETEKAVKMEQARHDRKLLRECFWIADATKTIFVS